LDALHVDEHVTVHVAPPWQVTLLPAPTVAWQVLFGLHATVADAPARIEHEAWGRHCRFALSVAVMEQVLASPHWVSHEPPHAPLHVAVEPHESLQPCVADEHCPVPPKSQRVPFAQVQVEPVQAGGAVVVLVVEEPPHAATREKAKKTVKKRRMGR
jgi:hypothetical protein